jgi:hypothetical protein
MGEYFKYDGAGYYDFWTDSEYNERCNKVDEI